MSDVHDQRGRGLHDLRISVTDRCNFRCTYCMPRSVFGPDYAFLGKSQLLSAAEIARLVALFTRLGVRKLRFTGGEPLLRQELDEIIARASACDGIEDVSLTSNGVLLSIARAEALRRAGVQRVNISLDALDNPTFMRLNDVGATVERVLDGIDNALAAGLGVKVNMVVKRGVNDHAVLPMARYFHQKPVILRFIEFMDVGNCNNWSQQEVYSAREILQQIRSEFALEALSANYPGEVARRWGYVDGGGEIGIIASVTQPFCGGCHRARLSATGQLFTCLFANEGTDLRDVLRSDLADEAIYLRLHRLWQQRDDAYSEQRHRLHFVPRKVEMSYIGG